MSTSIFSPDMSASPRTGRVRGASSSDTRQAATDVAFRNCKNELNKLEATLPEGAASKAQFHNELDSFANLFKRWLAERASGQKIDWDKINPPAEAQVHHYNNLPEAKDASILNKLAVLKLNGGLGTTMGCVGPKSAIQVRDGMTFLDLAVRQIEHLNEIHDVDVPLILMNSFNTHDDTARIIQKYSSHNIRIETFNQSRFPRINRDSLLPCPQRVDSAISEWYPPGHGDIFEALQNSGYLQQLLDSGKEWIFISNGDNLGADVDLKIFQHLINTKSEFIMEVTDKTKADVKGGTIIDYNGQVRLLEIAQVPSEHTEEFKSIKKFKIFNTNNVWVKLSAIKRVLEDKELSLEIIPNYKVTDNGESVIQLETAVGAAIKHFKGALGLNVPRSRFLPVKACSDLLLITSDLYKLEFGRLILNPVREFGSTPVVKLGDTFKKVADFQKRFKTIPNLSELDHLTVSGDVWFGKKVKLSGTVIIVAQNGSRIDIPDGSILTNKLVSGSLSIIDH